MYCARCGNEIPEGNGFCGRCGTAIPALHTEDATQQERGDVWSTQGTQRQGAPAQQAAQAAQAATQKTQKQGCLGCLIVIIALVVIAAILSSLSSSGSGASPAQRRAAFRGFAAELLGAMGQCDDASTTAQASFKAALNGGALLTAYQDAGTAHDTCSTASVSIDTMSVPGAISGAAYHLGDAQQDYANGANIRSSMWGHVQSALQNPSDLSAQSGVLNDAKSANQYETVGTAWIVEDAMTLTVPLAKITPIVPTPIGG